MSSLVELIKSKKTILQLVEENTTNLKPTKPEGWYIAKCPFHQADTGKDDPQYKRKFWIDNRPGRQICSCFVPKCAAQNPQGKPMDVINLYARLNNLPNRLAIMELADILGLLESPDDE